MMASAYSYRTPKPATPATGRSRARDEWERDHYKGSAARAKINLKVMCGRSAQRAEFS
jgi:hypothetical protein